MHQTEHQEKLQAFTCFKPVYAARITDIKADFDFGGNKLIFGDINDFIRVENKWLQRNGPIKVGGYYVVYGNNYRAYFPARQFHKTFALSNERQFEPLHEVESGKEYYSRSGYRCRVLMVGQHGQDCSVPMVCYMNLEPTFDSPAGKIWMVSESFFLSRFTDKYDKPYLTTIKDV